MTQTNDPLDFSAGEVADPSFPLLKEGTYRMEILEVKEVSSTKDGNESKRLTIRLGLTEDAVSTENQRLYKGWGFTDSIFLTPNENNTIKQISERVSMPYKAVLGVEAAKSVNVRQDIASIQSVLIGKPVDVKVGVKKSKDPQYNDNNVVKTWIVPTAAKT